MIKLDQSWWHKFKGWPQTCDCGHRFWIYVDKEETKIRPPQMEEVIPPLQEGSLTYVDNKEHRFHLAPGTVLCRDHEHYRMSLHFNDGKKTRNIEIWMPGHWIKPMPEWLYK